MYTKVTVIPDDSTITVDGHALTFPFTASPEVHAIQWKNGKGHIEYTTGAINRALGQEHFAAEVLPFVQLWEMEKARIEEEERRQREAAERPPTLEEARAAKLARIAVETESAIIAGFDYTVEGRTYHFSYDIVDQGNFTKTALSAALAHMGGDAAWRQSWRGWQPDPNGQIVPHILSFDAPAFLALATYAGKEHQERCMAAGWLRQEAAAAAQSPEELEGV